MSDDEDIFDVFNDLPALPTDSAPPQGSSGIGSATGANPDEHEKDVGVVTAPTAPPGLNPAVPSLPVRTAVTHADLMRLTAASGGPDSGEGNDPAVRTAGLPGPASAPSRGGMSIMASSPANDLVPSRTASAAPNPLQTYLQKESGIRVKHATSSLMQLPLFTAGAPIVSFAAVQRWLSASSKEDDVMPNTCIGVVVRRTDPKMGSRNAYAVMTLWDLQGGSPTPPHELAFLVCGAAFEHVLSKTSTGSVVAVSALSRMRSKSAATAPGGARDDTGGRGPSSLLRLSSVEAVRILGFAADLSTCESISKRSGERCTAMVNKRQTKHCVYHVADLRKAASASQGHARPPAGNTATGQTAVLKGGALTTHIQFSPNPSPISPSGVLSPAGHRGVLKPALVQSKQLLKKQQMNLFTVHGRSGLPTHVADPDASMNGAGIYAGVRSGDALPVTGLMSDTASRAYPSAQALGVSTRGRDALEAARLHEEQERTRQLLRRATAAGTPSCTTATAAPGSKRARDDAACSSTRESRRLAVEALKAKFAPLPAVGGGVGGPTAALPRANAVRRGDPKRNLLVGTVARAIAKGTIPSTTVSGGPNSQAPHTVHGEGKPSGRASTSAILAAADSAKSSLDHLRVQAARDRLNTYLDSEIVREKAREVLETITEQSIRGTYCFGCRNWYLRLPNSCIEAHHRTETRETKKRFIQCSLCRHKTFIVGENTTAAKVLPVCPQCKQHTSWLTSNAAPAIPDAPEDVHPF